MNKVVIVLASCLLVLGLVACNQNQPEKEVGTPPANQREVPPVEEGKIPLEEEESPAEDKDGSTAADPNQSVQQRPAMKEDVILLEGMEETFTFHLVEAKHLGFSTYVIEDMLAVEMSSPALDELLVHANFGGVKNEQAALLISSPKREDQVEITEFIKSKKEELESRGWQMEETSLDSHHPFAAPDSPVHVEEVYRLTTNDLVGRAIFFKHDERPYVLYYHYPPEFGDGFASRVHQLIADMVWLGSS